MMQDAPSKTELRQGLIEQVRRPQAVMRPLTADELRVLRGESTDDASRFGLHDTAG